jgi:hypothetical protein
MGREALLIPYEHTLLVALQARKRPHAVSGSGSTFRAGGHQAGQRATR